MPFKRYYLVYAGGLGFLVGLVIGQQFDLAYLVIYTLAMFGLVVIFLSKDWVRLLGVLLICLSIGIARYQLADQVMIDNSYENFYDQQVVIDGRIVSEVEKRTNQQKLVVKPELINKTPAQGKILITTKLYPEYSYGDSFIITGKLKQPVAFDSFAYDKYLARYGIGGVIYYPHIEVVDQQQGNPVYGSILKLKSRLIGRVNKLLPEPAASFLGGLLWGGKRAIPAKVMESFNLTGTTHIVALSGYNITVLGLILFFVGPWLGLKRQKTFWLVLSLVVFFIIITGWSASVVRAGIMGMLVLASYQFGWGNKAGILLTVSAVGMCLINPLVMFYDVGWQLSFAATISLLYIAPKFIKYFSKIPKAFALRETIATTLAAIIGTAPLVVYHFERLSLVALIANTLILFVIPITMGMGFLSVLVSFIFAPLGQFIAWLTYMPLMYILKITKWLSEWPWASLNLQGFSLILVILMYCFIIIITIHKQLWQFIKEKY